MKIHLALLRMAPLGVSAFLVACASQPPAPTPAPTPTARPAPAPILATTLAPAAQGWAKIPATAGAWQYANEQGETLAVFQDGGGQAVFVMRCHKPTFKIGMARPSAHKGQAQMRVLTETATRQFNAQPVAAASNLVGIELPSADPLLDAMALSKGRFAVELAGEETLYLPAWTQVSRVIEDCR